jgi:hypothetical protein
VARKMYFFFQLVATSTPSGQTRHSPVYSEKEGSEFCQAHAKRRFGEFARSCSAKSAPTTTACQRLMEIFAVFSRGNIVGLCLVATVHYLSPSRLKATSQIIIATTTSTSRQRILPSRAAPALCCISVHSYIQYRVLRAGKYEGADV